MVGEDRLGSFLLGILESLIRLLFRVEVKGSWSDYECSRVLVVANHQSILDELLLSMCLPRRPLFVLHQNSIDSFFYRWLLSRVDYLVIDPNHPISIKNVVRIIESGRLVVMFPEGRITRTGNLMKVYEGAAFVALKAGAQVVPVMIQGLAHSIYGRLPQNAPKKVFPKVILTLFQPERISVKPAMTGRRKHQLATLQIQKRLQEMMVAVEVDATLYSKMLEAVSLYGRRFPILEDMRGAMNYGQFLKASLGLGRKLSQLTLKDEAVGVFLPNLSITLALVLGLEAFGRIPAMLNYTSGVKGVLAACELVPLRQIVTSRSFIVAQGYEKLIRELGGIKVIYLEDIRQSISVTDRFRLFLDLCCPRRMHQKHSSEETGLVLFTSGSESRPKGVVLSHRALLSNINQVQAVLEFNPEDKVFNALPLFHSFGLTVGALLPLIAGVRCCLYPSPIHYKTIPEMIYTRDCSVLFGTSTFLGNYARYAHAYDFARLRYVIAGAEKLADSVRRAWFDQFGIRILEGYGATETAPVLSVNTPMHNRKGSVGRLLPGITGQIVPVLDAPGISTLHVTGPNVMKGYYRSDASGVIEPVASSLGSGWYDTGDVASMDEEGFLFIEGRVKRFAKVAGEMVSLEMIERFVKRLSPDFLHAISTKHDSRRGELIVLFTSDPMLYREQLIRAAKIEGLPEILVPKQIMFLEELPVLGAGKINHAALKEFLVEL
ncbi:MAG: AMP-binding protein [Proteobacteria bacterium]|nr:AMP-binding protein [Pseudomonadota bacterium]